jgi:hypothetical protein
LCAEKLDHLSWQSLAAWLEETTIYFDNLLPQSTAKMNESQW